MSSSLQSFLQEQLPRTWSRFFARHGNLTATQQAAIPPILAGQNTLLIAPTASGKTEAVIAPLLERHLLSALLGADDVAPRKPALRILYVCPTRALVRDLYERLQTPLAELGISFLMKSGDTGPVPLRNPPTVLLTTPESLDSLLTRAPRLFASVAAIVLDEIHLFDGTPRGDHLRCLLKRIEHIRSYQAQQTAKHIDNQAAPPLQRVALSATVPNAAGLVQRYLVQAGQVEPVAIVQIPGIRQAVGTVQPMANLDDLVTVLNTQMAGQNQNQPQNQSQNQIRKTLIFCNARQEVEQVAAYLREALPFEAAIFVHYSNLDPALRRQIEEGLAQASVAICVCTSTLELGIDIGSIGMVILLGPPPSPSAFIQRIGRAGRRRHKARVVGMARSRLEEVHFQALFQLAQQSTPAITPASTSSTQPSTELEGDHPFHLSVLVQQIFSILKQSPTGGIRLADLRRVAPDPLDDQTLRHLFNHLTIIHYLKLGRAGEWRAGAALAELVDAHEIYSNIGDAPQPIVVVDAFSGRAIAQTERPRRPGDTLLIGGRLMEVVWRAQYQLGVRAVAGGQARQALADAEPRLRRAPFAVSLAVGQSVAKLLGFSATQMVLLQTEQGAYLFHFWGDIYGELLAQILSPHLAHWDGDEIAPVTRINEHALQLPEAMTKLPAWEGHQVRGQVEMLLPRLEPFLELGRFYSLLPPDLAKQAAVEQVDLERFERLYRSATLITPTPAQRQRLLHILT